MEKIAYINVWFASVFVFAAFSRRAERFEIWDLRPLVSDIDSEDRKPAKKKKDFLFPMIETGLERIIQFATLLAYAREKFRRKKSLSHSRKKLIIIFETLQEK